MSGSLKSYPKKCPWATLDFVSWIYSAVEEEDKDQPEQFSIKEEPMNSKSDVFQDSGPTHLSSVDWNSSQHRRSVVASLIQGAYVMEVDRENHHSTEESLAPPWWEFFHFQLMRPLIDDFDGSIFGAIYEYKLHTELNGTSDRQHVPRFVIAFRGTMKKVDIIRDFCLIIHHLHKISWCEIAMQAVQDVVSTAGNSKIWLAGHSLGSAMAIIVGKNLALTGILLESFLFNPPFVCAPLEIIKNEKIKKGMRVVGSLIKVGFVMWKKGFGFDDSFDSLSSWIPHLFVNPKDPICSGYIGYFENRKAMEESGLGRIARFAAGQSLRGTILEEAGMESSPLQLLPSANLIVNESHVGTRAKQNGLVDKLRRAHGIKQWWKPDLDINQKQYLDQINSD